MLLLQPQEPITTIEEYEALPDNVRAEVFNGRIQYMASPSQIHQTILLELSSTINTYIKSKKGPYKVFPAPFNVKLNDNPLIIVQPDIMVVCDDDKLNGKRCNGAPDFIIEITSPTNQSDDYVKKLYYYENYGVREYWIVDPKRKIVTVNYFETNQISVQYPFSAIVKVNIYSDLYIDFKEIEQLLD